MSGRAGGSVLKVLAAALVLPFLLLTVGLVSCTGVTTASLRQSGCYGDSGSVVHGHGHGGGRFDRRGRGRLGREHGHGRVRRGAGAG